jgi:Zn-dependent protease with chaperone function
MQTTSLVEKLIPVPPLIFFARHFVGPNRIQVNTEWVAQMSDDELRVLLAHELGHAIDSQTERMGHPLFVGAEQLSIQFFADYIARLIAGNAQVDAFNAKYGIDFTGP